MTNIADMLAAATIPHDGKFLASMLKDAAKELVALRKQVRAMQEEIELLQEECRTRKQMTDVLNSVIDEFDARMRDREND